MTAVLSMLHEATTTLAPVPRGEGPGVRGSSLSSGENLGEAKSSVGGSRPLTPALSPEYGGEGDSATRLFRGRPVLDWTLRRLNRATSLAERIILCWDDQAAAVEPIARERGARIVTTGPRRPIASLDAVTAARRWADGWRGGPLQTCEFDRGFFAPWLLETAKTVSADALVLVDPAAGLVDPELIDALVRHADANPTRPLVFSPAAPGLGGVVLRASLLRQLAELNTHPGRFIQYQPTQPTRDPISELNCAPVPTSVARTTQRFTLDSTRQLAKVSHATAHLNGQLVTTGAEGLVAALQASDVDSVPREVTLELTTRRATRPIFLPQVERPDLSLDAARNLLDELSNIDDARLTLGGLGDPLLADNVFDVITAAADAGVKAIHVRTDLLGVSPERLAALIDSPVDLISIQIPAVTATTYQSIMGVDGLSQVIANVRILIERRAASGRATPILIPVFTKCRQNLAEMETWYDKWLGVLGSAVVTGPSDFAGRIEDHAVADMSPPLRRPCARLKSRLHVLSDGRIAPCEIDACGSQAVEANSIEQAWHVFASLRTDHQRGDWHRHEPCIRCREWHRP